MASYFIISDGLQTGPFEERDLLDSYSNGRISRESLIWSEGMDDWRKLSEVLDISSVPPPVPPDPASVRERPLVPHVPPVAQHPYPKWPVITFGICFLLFLLASAAVLETEDELRPYLRAKEMDDSGAPMVSSVIDSMAMANGGYGNPIGNILDGVNQSKFVQVEVERLLAERESAESNSSLFFILSLILAAVWFWKHRIWKKVQTAAGGRI